jgi:hypothetical protein
VLTLLVALPDGTQRMVDVLRSRITIGRLPHNAICIPDSSVSRARTASPGFQPAHDEVEAIVPDEHLLADEEGRHTEGSAPDRVF